jgi:hypothetical protein
MPGSAQAIVRDSQMKFEIFLLGLFKRRKIGPLSASPFGLVVFCLFVAAVVIGSMNVFEAKEIQAHLYAAVEYARPIAVQARLAQEQTGKWPASLAEIEAAKAKAPPQVARTLLARDGEVRLVFASPPAIANASLSMQVVVRGNEHFMECRAEGDFKGALPSFCRPGAEPARVSWRPGSVK